jgi:hypothetical protein
MNTPILSYRGRTVTAADLDAIRVLLAAHPQLSRRAFSQRLCEHWDWRQPNGALRDMVARSLLLALHRAGHIALPPVRQQPPNNAIARRCPAPVGKRPANYIFRPAGRGWHDGVAGRPALAALG